MWTGPARGFFAHFRYVLIRGRGITRRRQSAIPPKEEGGADCRGLGPKPPSPIAAEALQEVPSAPTPETTAIEREAGAVALSIFWGGEGPRHQEL
jgi:hypothetical protein